MSTKKDKDAHVSVDSMGRRTWDKEYYAQKAREAGGTMYEEGQSDDDAARKRAHVPVASGPLQARKKVVGLSAQAGKSTMLSSVKPISRQGGFFCEICNCILKDSSAYLDHINSPKHLRNKGIMGRPEMSSLEEVKARIQKKRMELLLKQQKQNKQPTEVIGTDYVAEEDEKEEKDFKRKANKADDDDDDPFKKLGLPSSFK